MKKFKIVIDQDDVLTLTYKRWLELYNKEWNDTLTLDGVHSWDWSKWVKPECGKKIYSYLNSYNFFLDMEPHPGAIEGMKQLINDGHDVVIATAVPNISENGYKDKFNWVKNHLPFFNMDNFIAAHRKDLIAGDILFDDGPHNCKSFTGISVCMHRPWNKKVDCCEFRILNWKEFVNIVKTLQSNGSLYVDCMYDVKMRLKNNE